MFPWVSLVGRGGARRAVILETHGSLNDSDPSGLPNAKVKSPRFSYAISQIATLPPVVALNRSSKSQIAAIDTLRFGTQFPKSHWPLSSCDPKSQRFKSHCLQDANATKSQTLALYRSQRLSTTKTLTSSRNCPLLQSCLQNPSFTGAVATNTSKSYA